MEELEMAAWLHDCGKITTPEFVVDKHTKLETIFDRIHLIDSRIEILRRAGIEHAQGEIQLDTRPFGT
jgi:HD superfamily phosphodiesterase